MAFWQTLTVSIIGVVLSAALSVGLTLWLRYKDSPKADWFIEPLSNAVALLQRAELRNSNLEPALFFALANAGDGTAYQISIKGKNCEAMFLIADPTDPLDLRMDSRFGALPTNETLKVVIWRTSDSASFVLTWLDSPIRRGRFVHKQFPLSRT